jgi:hypothetical protein
MYVKVGEELVLEGCDSKTREAIHKVGLSSLFSLLSAVCCLLSALCFLLSALCSQFIGIHETTITPAVCWGEQVGVEGIDHRPRAWDHQGPVSQMYLFMVPT